MRLLRRYLPSELLLLVAAVACSQLVVLTTANVALSALAGAYGETIAYYGTMLVREVRHHPAQRMPITVRNMLIEFGLAEALLLRPALMYLATQLVANVTFGVLLGKLAADVLFYLPTIPAFELRRRYLPA